MASSIVNPEAVAQRIAQQNDENRAKMESKQIGVQFCIPMTDSELRAFVEKEIKSSKTLVPLRSKL